MDKPIKISKGFGMEETLRSYFLQSGYYVSRGVPFRYDSFDITDIDLWLYHRTSPFSREVSIVDIKNKKTPQAIERIFWAQGLKSAIKANNAIVATTDRRREVTDFGRDLGIVVLDGSFLSRLDKLDNLLGERLTEEEFTTLIQTYPLEKMDGGWTSRMRLCKSLLSSDLGFDSCNEWLYHLGFFLEQAMIKPQQREIAYRCCFLILSYLAITVDYLLKEILFLERPMRIQLLRDGFTFGDRGKAGLEQILDVTMNLVEQHAENGTSISAQIKTSIRRSLSSNNSAILAEHLSKNDVGRCLFQVAVELESAAMSRGFVKLASIGIESRSFVLCIADYFGVERSRLI
jgi:hypothetical protein